MAKNEINPYNIDRDPYSNFKYYNFYFIIRYYNIIKLY